MSIVHNDKAELEADGIEIVFAEDAFMPVYIGQPPVVFGMEHQPIETLIFNNEIWSRSQMIPLPRIVARVNNATVYKEGVVKTQTGKLITESLQNNPEPDVSGAPSETIEAPIGLMRKQGERNFGHWLIEILPRLALFKNIERFNKMHFLIAEYPSATLPLRKRTIEMAHVGVHRIVAQNHDPIACKELYITAPNSIHSHTHAPWAIQFLEEWSARFRRDSRRRRLYLPRSPGSKRCPSNARQIEEMMVARGYEVLYPETLPIEKQIQAFSQATRIVAPVGAALTNLLWSPREARILALTPGNAREHFFWDLASHQGKKYIAFLCPKNGSDEWVHADYDVNLEHLEMAVKLLEYEKRSDA